MTRYKKIYVEITNVCNLQCTFCPKTTRPADFMSPTAFKHILTSIRPFTDYIYLHVLGEPLLHPQLGILLDISENMGFKVNITTNGTLIAQTTQLLLGKRAVRQINFSLHSFDGNEQGGSKEAYLDNILKFTQQATSQTDIIIALRLWNLAEELLNEDQRYKNAAMIHKIEEHFTLPYKIQGVLAKNKGLKVAQAVYLHQDYEFSWPNLAAAEDQRLGTCWGLRRQVGILVDGTVVPCCLDGEGAISLGNVFHTAFGEIIESSRAQAIRRGFCNHQVVEELCRKCGFRKRFI